MSNRDPKGFWDLLRDAFHDWIEEDDDAQQASDPALLFHMLFTVPLVVALAVAARRLMLP